MTRGFQGKKNRPRTSDLRFPAVPSIFPIPLLFVTFSPPSSASPPVEPARLLSPLHSHHRRRAREPPAHLRPRRDDGREEGAKPRAADSRLRVPSLGRAVGDAVLPGDARVRVLLLLTSLGGKNRGSRVSMCFCFVKKLNLNTLEEREKKKNSPSSSPRPRRRRAAAPP